MMWSRVPITVTNAGTPEFMAPELYEEEYTELVDIYSFGMCLLEILTSDYPYSECTNPAQIYKKVTSGKLPEAFYGIPDVEAREFVGRCLATASKRLPAKELLLDPFLASDDGEKMTPARTVSSPILGPRWASTDANVLPMVPELTRNTEMTITGTVNSEDGTIYLKVQISDRDDGHARNIFFSFDIANDTSISVATEMVKELEITEWDAMEIAEMIEEEIGSLDPTWKGQSLPHDGYNRQESFNCEEDDDDEDDDSSFHGIADLRDVISISTIQSWLHEDTRINDETASLSSMASFKYSNFNYSSGNESDDSDLISPRRRDSRAHCSSRSHQTTNPSSSSSSSASRFCPKEIRQTMYLPQQNPGPSSANSPSAGARYSYSSDELREVPRIRSLLDIRSQLLQKSLLEEVSRGRIFVNTVGAVENIGFQEPCRPSRSSLDKDRRQFRR
ncbi:hypothetical protein SAY86_029449 [Trapa natans]|uniref:non-specific serine/threonine protein kinase n=1 Tax=Trapa natans TaxID=22666 RepID=A0AAN7MLN6_TRANT|nr:hypothetical protein SAY86_029449 [Trapa natans]